MNGNSLKTDLAKGESNSVESLAPESDSAGGRAAAGEACVPDLRAHWEQHFVHPEALAGVLDGFPLAGRRVLELGAGTGTLTRALLAQGVEHVEAWEIDPELTPVRDARVTWRVRDIALLKPEDLADQALVAFAPYALLPVIEAVLQKSTGDWVLMIPERRLDAYLAHGWRVWRDLPGEAFTPNATGRHPIVVKGFGAASFVRVK